MNNNETQNKLIKSTQKKVENLLKKSKNIIRNRLLKFTQTEVEKFLEQNPKKVFYAFAYDCVAAEKSLYLCFNTEEDFAKTLKEYQDGKYSDEYQKEDEIFQLKYNTGDWDYQAFAMYFFDEMDELKELVEMENEIWEIGNDVLTDQIDDKIQEELMIFFTETLIEFSKTKSFEKIPKTKDFKFFCIDHDEEFEDAQARFEKVKRNSF